MVTTDSPTMTSRGSSTYSSIVGNYGTYGVFVKPTGNQEVLLKGNISTEIFHTKLMIGEENIDTYLPSGIQLGQLKKLTFCFKNSDDDEMVVRCPLLSGAYSRIRFQNEGDYCLLIWTNVWSILESGNTVDPMLGPLVE